MFHNTTKATGDTLKRYHLRALSQDEIIVQFFKNNPGVHSPFDVQAACLSDSPITSVRRSMTNLTNEGVLTKTDIQKMGPLGRPTYLWDLTERQGRLF